MHQFIFCKKIWVILLSKKITIMSILTCIIQVCLNSEHILVNSNSLPVKLITAKKSYIGIMPLLQALQCSKQVQMGP